MSAHKQFTMATDVDVFFCDPYSLWQRGSNENTNRLIRQYLPKGIDLSIYSRAKLNEMLSTSVPERPSIMKHRLSCSTNVLR